MTSILTNRLKDIAILYKNLIHTKHQSFEVVKLERFDQRELLEGEEQLLMTALQEQMQSLQQDLRNEGVRLSLRHPVKISEVITVLKDAEKEELIQAQKDVMELDYELRKVTQNIMYYSRAMMEVCQGEIDAAIHIIGREKGSSTSVLMNRKV